MDRIQFSIYIFSRLFKNNFRIALEPVAKTLGNKAALLLMRTLFGEAFRIPQNPQLEKSRHMLLQCEKKFSK